MELDKLQFPAFLYRSIFKNHLVDLKSNTDRKISKSEREIQFLGGNEKKVTFLFNDDANKFLPDAQMKFLSDLLTACHLNMADIAIVNIHGEKIAYNDLVTQLQPEKVLLFGVSTNDLDLPFTIPFFQIQNYQLTTYMVCPGLEEIQQSLALKKQLWSCLQKIFKIKSQK